MTGKALQGCRCETSSSSPLCWRPSSWQIPPMGANLSGLLRNWAGGTAVLSRAGRDGGTSSEPLWRLPH